MAVVGSLLAHQSRILMLEALLFGLALTAGELGRAAGVSPSTASAHLALLQRGGLLDSVVQGRHRYYRISGPEVAEAMESLARIAPPCTTSTLRQSSRAGSLKDSRLCYDHLAGRSGVMLMDAMLARGWLVPVGRQSSM